MKFYITKHCKDRYLERILNNNINNNLLKTILNDVYNFQNITSEI
jgi:hypothetical protein